MRRVLLTSVMSMTCLLLLSEVIPGTAVWAQEGVVEGPLSTPKSARKAALDNDAVIRMTKAGLDEALILQTIRSQPGEYRTGPDELIALRDAGVSPAVLSAMMAHTSGMAERKVEPVNVVPLSPEVDENGVYHKDREGKWVMIDPELVHYKSGGWIKSTMTDNIIKKDRNGEVSGGESKLVLRAGDELIILAPANTDPIEYQLLRFRLHSSSREFRASTGGVFNSRDSTDRDQVAILPKRVAPRVYSFKVPADIGGGEYGVLPPGSASTPGIAFAGKIYTFAVTTDK